MRDFLYVMPKGMLHDFAAYAREFKSRTYNLFAPITVGISEQHCIREGGAKGKELSEV